MAVAMKEAEWEAAVMTRVRVEAEWKKVAWVVGELLLRIPAKAMEGGVKVARTAEVVVESGDKGWQQALRKQVAVKAIGGAAEVAKEGEMMMAASGTGCQQVIQKWVAEIAEDVVGVEQEEAVMAVATSQQLEHMQQAPDRCPMAGAICQAHSSRARGTRSQRCRRRS